MSQKMYIITDAHYDRGQKETCKHCQVFQSGEEVAREGAVCSRGRGIPLSRMLTLGEKSMQASMEGKVWHVCGLGKVSSRTHMAARMGGSVSQLGLELIGTVRRAKEENLFRAVAGDADSARDDPTVTWLRCVTWPVCNFTQVVYNKGERRDMSMDSL